MRKIVFIFVLLLIGIAPLIISSYSDYVSPKKQLESGVLPEDIQCRENKVLVIRDNGNPACVTSKTSEKLLDRGYTMVVSSDEIIFKDNIKPTTPKTITEYNETKLSSPANAYSTSKTGEELEKIPNPDGYWTPIVDKNAFAEHFLSVVDDEIIEDGIDHRGEIKYATRDGFLAIKNNYQFSNGYWASVTYRSIDTAYDIQKQAEYINNFMNKIGFKVDGNDVALSESYLDNCIEKVWNNKGCKKLHDSVRFNINPFGKYDTTYELGQKYSGITFIFYNKAYYTYSDFGIEIKFHGWTNHPELIKTMIDQKSAINGVIAVQKAYDFALKNEELNKSHRDGGHCEYESDEIMLGRSADKNLIIISGVPYYMIDPGSCTYDRRNTGHVQFPLIAVDAWTGDSIFLTYVGGLD